MKTASPTATSVASFVAFFSDPDGDTRPCPGCLVCLVRVVFTLPFVHQMQDAIETNELVWAVVASAVRLVLHLIYVLHLLYAGREPIRSVNDAFRKGKAKWTLRVQLGCWLFSLCAEVAIAGFFGHACARGLPYARALLEVWRGVSLLAAEALEVIRSSLITEYY